MAGIPLQDITRPIFGLFNDLFFAYNMADDTINLYNTEDTVFEEGSFPFEDFSHRLHNLLDENDLPTFVSFVQHLHAGTPNFTLSFTDNFLNESSNVIGVLVKGVLAETEDGSKYIVGLMHPKWMRRITPKSDLHTDALTNLIDKADITRLAIDLIDRQHQAPTTLAILDIDYFKYVNDSYGHQYGDYVLQQIAEMIKGEVGEHGSVGRIGGDEFFIIFHNLSDGDILRDHLRNIRTLVNKEFEGKGPQGDKPISLSIGTASYPKDADNYTDLFLMADYCLYRAKEKGRNRYIIYTPEKHASLDEIKNNKEKGNLINGRSNLPLGDALTQILFMVKYGKKPPLTSLLSEIAERFEIPYCSIFLKEGSRLVYEEGTQTENLEVDRKELINGLLPGLTLMNKNYAELIVCNNIHHLPDSMNVIVERLAPLDLYSFILLPFTDKAGNEAVLAFCSFHTNLVWNEMHFIYYRLFLDSLTFYDLGSELTKKSGFNAQN